MAGLTAKTLAEYARAQGVDMAPSVAAQHYQAWKAEHPRDALLFERAHKLQEREDDGCSWPHCRSTDYDIRYLVGSTELTRSMDAQLCAEHHRDFCRALDIVRGTDTEDED